MNNINYLINKYGKIIDLTQIEDLSYSAIMRKLRQQATQSQIMDFLRIYKAYFDQAIKHRVHHPERIALQKTLIKFNKLHSIKLDQKMIKNAALAELGTAEQVGKYLANIVRFILSRISDANRGKAINNIRNKIYMLNENELGNKKMPASAALGQSITFIKHVLFNQDPSYIRQVLNHLVKAL